MINSSATRAAGILMIAAAAASNIAFAGLGKVFGYPDVLREPATEILARFDADRTGIIALFLLLAAAAGCIIPIAVVLGRLNARTNSVLPALATVAGVIAGVVQVLGLLRWAYAVPVLADAATDPATRATAVTVFEVLHQYLGVAVGETLGYLFTAAWTLLVIASHGPGLLTSRWSRWAGIVAALAILAGVLEPAGVAIAGTVNFAGYVLWSLWLIAFGVSLIRGAAKPQEQ